MSKSLQSHTSSCSSFALNLSHIISSHLILLQLISSIVCFYRAFSLDSRSNTQSAFVFTSGNDNFSFFTFISFILSENSLSLSLIVDNKDFEVENSFNTQAKAHTMFSCLLTSHLPFVRGLIARITLTQPAFGVAPRENWGNFTHQDVLICCVHSLSPNRRILTSHTCIPVRVTLCADWKPSRSTRCLQGKSTLTKRAPSALRSLFKPTKC